MVYYPTQGFCLPQLPQPCLPQSSYPIDDASTLICHELRTPLTVIHGVLKLLEYQTFGTLSPEGQQLLDIAVRNTQRLTRLANTLEHGPSTIDTMISIAEVDMLRLENDLLTAFNLPDFFLHYQPIIATQSNQIVGFEALARWRHPTRDVVSPDIFIPLTEKLGLIRQLGLYLLEQACQQLKVWQQRFPGDLPLTMNVNLSTLQLTDPEFCSQVQAILQATGLAPDTLKLEVTESALIQNHDVALKTFMGLKAIGVKIYLDDFGTGYSSLARLQDLPFDALKIDQSFVRNHNWSISEAILLLASHLNLDVVAEGIETPEQLHSLRELNCPKMQGYLFSKPLTGPGATHLLEQQYIPGAQGKTHDG